MSKKAAAKIGLFASICMLIGSVIGIGIFFKNNSVFTFNNSNGIGILISWILASLIAFFTAFSFAEIGFGKNYKAGVAGSVEELLGKKAGRWMTFNLSFFYYGVLIFAISIFSAEAILNIFTSINEFKIHVGFLFLIGSALFSLFMTFNYFSIKWSSRFQILSTSLKFLPIVFIAMLGIIGGIMGKGNNLFDITNSSNPHNSQTFSFAGIMGSLPAILFAYDSFLCVGNLKNDITNPQKNVPLTLIIGMGIAIFLYLFITIGQIVIGGGTASNVINNFFNTNKDARTIFNIIINIFILISILGVLNAMCATGLKASVYLCESKTIVGWWKTNNFNNPNKKGFVVAFIIYFLWFVALLIPSTIYNTDIYIDVLSNFPTLFLFLILGIIMIKAIINKFNKKNPSNYNMKGFVVFASIGALGCILAFSYQIFYGMSTKIFIDGIYQTQKGFGLFFGNGVEIKGYELLTIFILCLFIFVSGPFLNDLLILLTIPVITYKYNQKTQNDLYKTDNSNIITLETENNDFNKEEYLKELLI